jgi:DNA-binding transcriptional MerR regulator
MFIGEVAKRAGVSAHTIRYYEAERLIGRPARSAAGYRVYSTRVIDELAFVRRAQALGLSLTETREILNLGRSGESPCDRVASICETRLADIERRMDELRTFRDNLRAAYRAAKNGCSVTTEGFCQAILTAMPSASLAPETVEPEA